MQNANLPSTEFHEDGRADRKGFHEGQNSAICINVRVLCKGNPFRSLKAYILFFSFLHRAFMSTMCLVEDRGRARNPMCPLRTCSDSCNL